jgi:hypothetical protein
MFSNYKSTQKKYSDDFELGVIEDQILFEVIIELDSFKSINFRESTQVLDFLGNIGGFYQAINLLVLWVAQYFSGKLFISSIASHLFMVKKKKSGEID